MQIYAPGTHIGQYEIASHPIIGGMGVVYFCIDTANDRHVALKTFKPEYLPNRTSRDRFLREGTAWVALGNHPHIVRCHAVEYSDPTPFLVLELIAKEPERKDASLRAWLGKPMPLAQVLLFTMQIAHGMRHATNQIPGFVHRDLKPENVLVGADKLPGTNINRLRVTDFGLASMLKDENKTAKDEDGPQSLGRTHLTHGILGTPLYMAPEQWLAQTVGVYTDVYALGCMMQEMLTGLPPVVGHNLKDLRLGHCAGKLSPLPEDLPPNVRELLKRSLFVRASGRFQSWAEFILMLEQVYTAQGLGDVIQTGTVESESQAELQQTGWSYNDIGLSYLDIGKAQVAVGYFEKALQIARETGNRNGEAAAFGSLGNAYLALGDARRAIGYFEQQLPITRKTGNRHGEGNALGNLGIAYKNLGDAQQAIGYSKKHLAIARKIGDQLGESKALNNLGSAYMALGDVRRAIRYYEQCLEIVRKIDDRRGKSNVVGNLGVAFAALGDMRQAIGYYELSLNVHREIGDRRMEGVDLGNLGVAYAALGETGRAMGYYEQQLLVSREVGDLNGIAVASLNMSLLYQGQGDKAKALPLAQEAARAFAQIGHAEYTQRAQIVVGQMENNAGHVSASEILTNETFAAFQHADSLTAMQAAVGQHPVMRQTGFVQAIENIIREQIRPEHQPAFRQRLSWLKEIAQKTLPQKKSLT